MGAGIAYVCKDCARVFTDVLDYVDHDCCLRPSGVLRVAADTAAAVSGRILGSPAQRSGAGNQGSTAGQSRVPRRSEAEPGNDQAQFRA